MRNSEIGKEVIKKQLPLIPKLPGVYKMLSINNEILYVGKAKISLIDLKVTFQRRTILFEQKECSLKLKN